MVVTVVAKPFSLQRSVPERYNDVDNQPNRGWMQFSHNHGVGNVWLVPLA